MTAETHHQRVLIVDFGSQVTQLIARRVREAGVYCEIHPFDKAEAMVDDYAPSAIILSGGPASVLEADSPRIGTKLFDLGVPMLCVCYGEQLLCDVLGGKVEGGHAGEFGRAELTIGKHSPLFQGLAGIGELETVWMSHGDRVTAIPEGFEVIATSTGAPFAAVANDARKIYGVQFHPEVVHTVNGSKIYRNFLFNIAGLTGDWTMASFRQEMVQKIRTQVGDGKVICGLSGGVDSSVAAVLIHEAIGDQLTCVFVDTGLLRKNEADQVVTLFRDHYNIPLIHVDAGRGVPGRSGRCQRPGDQAQDHRRQVHRHLRPRGRQDRRRQLPGPGHALSRRGRERLGARRPLGGDQEPPQCRRPAGLHEAEAGRAAARAVQGRGSRLGRRAGPGPAFVGRHPFPGPGLAIRIPATSRPRRSRSCRTPMPSTSKRSATPASTTRSGRPSPCYFP
jgi:GMP synthase (glutamine-hydrolysing)